MKRIFGVVSATVVLLALVVASVFAGGYMSQLNETQLRRYSTAALVAGSFISDTGGVISLPLHTTSSVSCTTQAVSLKFVDQAAGQPGNLSTTARPIGWVTFTHTASWAPALDSLIVYAQYSEDGSNFGVSTALIAGVSTAGSRLFKVPLTYTQGTSATDVTADGTSFVRFIISATDAGAVSGTARFKYFVQTNDISRY